MSMFTLAISFLITSNLPSFMDLTFQISMQHCSLQHWTSLSPPDTSTTEHHLGFGPAASFFLKLLVIAFCSSPGAYWAPFTWETHLPVSYLLVFSYCSCGSHSKNIGVVCHSLFQWTTFCQNSSLWHVCLRWYCMAWLSFIELCKLHHHNKAVGTNYMLAFVLCIWSKKFCYLINFCYLPIFKLLSVDW